ncbi:MAG TPA: Maf family protein [Ktedonobacterales bacterium]
MTRPTLYLASTSPRRRQLLRDAAIPFELVEAPVDEDALTTRYAGPLSQLGPYLAREKALAGRVALLQARKAGLVLAADTTVLLDGESLAKPADHEEATRMLLRLRGRTHTVITGVALTATGTDECVTASSSTDVVMRAYSDEEMTAFVATDDPLDKAGAYSIQHPDFQPVQEFHGCHLGVVGLPMCIVEALVASGPLPPQSGPNGASCRWSAQCTRPLPGPGSVHGSGHTRPEDQE